MAPPMISKVSIDRMTTTQKVRPAGARLGGRLENRYIGNIVAEIHPLLRVDFDGRAAKVVCMYAYLHALMYVCIHLCKCLCMNLCNFLCMYVCM